MITRPATADDVPLVVDTLVRAFDQDPTWSTVLPDDALRPAQYTYLFTLFVEGALPHGGVWTTDAAEAVSVWLPPGADELTPEQDEQLELYLDRLPHASSDAVRALIALFDENHPTDRPHHYLSLLGTHPNHRGQGVGMDLVRSDLARIDALGDPAYLESTNPANLDRYASVGFVPLGEFTLHSGGPTVTTMWREPR